MYRLLVWTSKGGTRKTSTVANTGPELARLGYRVLMVGFDPQGDLEVTFGVNPDDQTVVRVEQLLESEEIPDTAPVAIDLPLLPRRGRRAAAASGELHLLASSPGLLASMIALAQREYRDLDRVLNAFDDVADIALIDTQGALTSISRTAAWAADGVLFVGEPGFYEARALATRLAELEELREEGLVLTPVGLLFVRSDARSRQMRAHREHFSSEDFGSLHIFKTHTRQQASVRDDPSFGLPTVLLDPNSHVAQDYRAFAQELSARLEQLAEVQA